MPASLPYKLLALDMDGTLLDSRKQVPPRTRAAIRGLAARGVAIAFCTGRNVTELSDYRAQLPFIRYGSLVSGALALDFETNQALAVTPLATDLACQVIQAGRAEGAMVHMLCLNASVTEQRFIDRMDTYHMAIYHDMFDRLCTRADGVEDYVRSHEGQVLKVNLYHRDPQSRLRTRSRLEGLPLKLADAETTSLESTAEGVSKDRGLAALCQGLGISMGQVVAVGDADNDTDALRAAGYAVAMGNATPTIKGLADLVVADNDHDGIVQAINCLFPHA